MTSNLTAIEFLNVSKTYLIHKETTIAIRDIFLKGQNPLSGIRSIKALDDISFRVSRNEKFGIIGRNGSGKSTIVNLIMGAMRPDHNGTVKTEGRVMKLEPGTGFDDELDSKQNVMLSGSLLGLSQNNSLERYNEIIDFAELEEFKDIPVKHLSKGMRERLAFATAMHVNPEIMLLDEFFGGGGDIRFKKKSDAIFKERVLKDKALVIVSHSLDIIRNYCDRVIWLEQGAIKMMGNPEDVCHEYETYYR